MALYFSGEIVGVKRKAPEVITMVNGYPHVTYPAFDIVGKIICRILCRGVSTYGVKVNNSDCILRVSDRDIFKIDYAGESEVFDSILLNDPLSQPYIYLGEFADHVLNKKRETSGFGGFTQLSKKELKYAEADVKATKETLNAYVTAKYSYRYDPKYLERSLKNIQQNSLYGMHPEYFPGYHFTPVRRPLKALEELNKREFERIAASPIRIDIDDAIKANYSIEEIKKMINNTFGVPKFEYKKIIFSGPCTIILWKDGTKTIAKASGGDIFDPEKGVAICFMKRVLGETEGKKILRKANKQYEDYLTENGIYPTLDLKDLHALEPTEYRLNFVNNIARVSDINPNSVICIDQSAIEKVKKVEEEQDESK